MKPAIRLVGLTKRFGTQTVLDGIDLDIARGELFVLMGLSGTGKSVLLKHLIRLHTPDAGRVEIEGEDLASKDERALIAYLKRVGMVFQHAALFDSMSAGDNIAFPLREQGDRSPAEIRERVDFLLDKVRLRGVYDKLPSELSGGMRKRVGIARGLALAPDFVYFDEPTSGLDLVTATVIEDLILETHHEFGYTGVVITHRWELAQRLADRVALLWQGRIHSVGTPQEMETSDDRIVRGFLNRDPSVLKQDA